MPQPSSKKKAPEVLQDSEGEKSETQPLRKGIEMNKSTVPPTLDHGTDRRRTITDRVRHLVAATGHTSADVARVVGCSVEDVEQLLNGDDMEFTLRHMFQVSDAIGVDPFEMVAEVAR